jgi:sialic acid synthase SpsE
VFEAHSAAIQAMAEGQKASDVYEAARRIIQVIWLACLFLYHLPLEKMNLDVFFSTRRKVEKQ